jgi:hypothetical protein
MRFAPSSSRCIDPYSWPFAARSRCVCVTPPQDSSAAARLLALPGIERRCAYRFCSAVVEYRLHPLPSQHIRPALHHLFAIRRPGLSETALSDCREITGITVRGGREAMRAAIAGSAISQLWEVGDAVGPRRPTHLASPCALVLDALRLCPRRKDWAFLPRHGRSVAVLYDSKHPHSRRDGRSTTTSTSPLPATAR